MNIKKSLFLLIFLLTTLNATSLLAVKVTIKTSEFSGGDGALLSYTNEKGKQVENIIYLNTVTDIDVKSDTELQIFYYHDRQRNIIKSYIISAPRNIAVSAPKTEEYL